MKDLIQLIIGLIICTISIVYAKELSPANYILGVVGGLITGSALAKILD